MNRNNTRTTRTTRNRTRTTRSSRLVVAALAAGASFAVAAPMTSALEELAPVVEQTCPKAGMVVTPDHPTSIKVTAPFGKLITGLCVKRVGFEPHFLEVNSAPALSYNSDTPISHYTVTYIDIDPVELKDADPVEPDPDPQHPDELKDADPVDPDPEHPDELKDADPVDPVDPVDPEQPGDEPGDVPVDEPGDVPGDVPADDPADVPADVPADQEQLGPVPTGDDAPAGGQQVAVEPVIESLPNTGVGSGLLAAIAAALVAMGGLVTRAARPTRI